MSAFNLSKARAVLAGLPLTANLRRYADYWLALQGGTERDFDPATVDDILRNTVQFEVRPRRRAIWLSAGRTVNEGLGVNLAGRDYAAMASPTDRPLRLARMTVVATGCASLQTRWAMNSAGRLHFLKELALPMPAGPNGAPRTMTFVDSENASVGRVQIDKGVMGLAATFDAHPLA